MFKRMLPLAILALGVAVFVLLRATRPEPDSVAPSERSWRVETLAISLAERQPTLPLFGEVVSPSLTVVVAPVAARVAERPVRDGQRVTRGALLVALDDADVLPLVAQAEADVADFEAQLEAERIRHDNDRRALVRERELLENARRQLERNESLVTRNLASRADVDAARDALTGAQLTVTAREGSLAEHPARLARLEAGLARAMAALAIARRDAERSRVTAPFDGVVTRLQVAPGDQVAARAALLSVYPLDDLELRARLPRRYQRELLAALDAGQRLEARDDNGNRFTLVGLAGEGDPSGTEAILRLAGEAGDLRPGSLVPIVLERPAVGESLAVPYSALYGDDTLYLIDDEQRMQRIRVTRHGEVTGPGGEPWLLVSGEALAPGRRVVVTHLPNAIEGLRLEDAGHGEER
ncbi:efflux RND transporter periplasmic adaptor subunit [Halomonas sp. C05BenzN]|uniref:efflux RND transporter periplasmic adaptor subunit n=1 Tax=Halomonas sp. C05BenzN TaxID=3411041 RepID=UPI003B936E4F